MNWNTTDWSTMLDGFGRKLLVRLGEDPDRLPGTYNPVTRALNENPNLVEELDAETDWFRKKTCRIKLSRAAVICQMAVYDHQNGPEMDGKQTSLREQWYRYFKVKFAQPMAAQLDEIKFDANGIPDDSNFGLAWFGRMSVTYGELVDTGRVTYQELWIEDASRKMEAFFPQLFQKANILFCVEKDGMMKRFTPLAKALGAACLYSGKGVPSKAAAELALREHFGWREGFNPFTKKNPLHVVHVSDHDYSGEAVIGLSFAEQCRRYTSHIREVRIGISPYQVTDAGYEWEDTWYAVKVKNNSAYIEWAEQKALFWATCMACQHRWIIVGSEESSLCPVCAGRGETIEVTPKTKAYGFEVEAMYTKDYRPLVVEALLEILPLDYIVERLREECKASASSAARTVAEEIYANNADYKQLLEEFERLEEIKAEFEAQVEESLTDLGEPHVSDWENDDDDPDADDYKGFVITASDWTGPWRPFSTYDRTAKLIKYLQDECQDEIEDLSEQEIEF